MSLVNDEDQIVPLIDVTKNAIRSDDITTARDGIRKLETILCDLLEYDGNKDGIIKHFSEHLKRISDLSFTKNNEYIIIELSESLARIADKALEKNEISQDAIGYVTFLLAEIGEESSNRLWKKSITSSINSIGSIYIKAEKSGILLKIGISYVVRESLNRIVLKALKKDLYFVRFYVLPPITDICIKAVYGVPKETDKTLKILQDIVSKLGESIVNIGRTSLEYEKDSVSPILSYEVVHNLTQIGASIADVEKNAEIKTSISSVMKSQILHFNWPIDKEDFIIMGLVSPVENLGLSYSSRLSMKSEIWGEVKSEYEQNIELKCDWVIDFLKDIGTVLKTKSLLRSLGYVGSSIISIGSNCIREFPEGAKYAARALKELDIDDLVENELKGQPEFNRLYLQLKDGARASS